MQKEYVLHLVPQAVNRIYEVVNGHSPNPSAWNAKAALALRKFLAIPSRSCPTINITIESESHITAPVSDTSEAGG